MNALTPVSSTPLHSESARAAGPADDISQDLLEVVGGVAAAVTGVVATFSAGPVAASVLPAAASLVGPIGGSTLLATALSLGPAAASALPAIVSPEIGALAVAEGSGLDNAPSSIDRRRETPTAAKPGLHDLSITKVIDQASNQMMSMQAAAGLVPVGGLHPDVAGAARPHFSADAAKAAELINGQAKQLAEQIARQ
jgi:hypothetical protein